jgi:hypothetical protein
MVMVIVDHVYGCGYTYGFGMNLYHSNQVLIKLDQLKLLTVVS